MTIPELQTWAENRLQNLKQQLAGVDRRMEELRTFIRVGQTVTDRQGNAPTGTESFRARIIRILDNHGGPMNISSVALELKLSGFKPSGKCSIKTLVGVELSRLAREGGSGLVHRVGTGLYESSE